MCDSGVTSAAAAGAAPIICELREQSKWPDRSSGDRSDPGGVRWALDRVASRRLQWALLHCYLLRAKAEKFSPLSAACTSEKNGLLTLVLQRPRHVDCNRRATSLLLRAFSASPREKKHAVAAHTTLRDTNAYDAGLWRHHGGCQKFRTRVRPDGRRTLRPESVDSVSVWSAKRSLSARWIRVAVHSFVDVNGYFSPPSHPPPRRPRRGHSPIRMRAGDLLLLRKV